LAGLAARRGLGALLLYLFFTSGNATTDDLGRGRVELGAVERRLCTSRFLSTVTKTAHRSITVGAIVLMQP
jgi:hypothetical protein